jgi:DNA-binding NtrC family response regulator
MQPRLLLAEDEPVQRQMLSSLLSRKLGYQVTAVENGKEAIAALRTAAPDTFDVVLLDIQMPVMDGFEALRTIHRLMPDVSVLMLTAQKDTDLAVKAIKEGAVDFIVKPPHPDHLDVILKNTLQMRQMRRELSRLKRDKEGGLFFSDLIGYQTGLKEVVQFGRKAAQSDVPVLIHGETGVGKELFARAIHGESKRSGAPFIAINCGAIPANLVESILFGHEKGAFTSATHKTIGKFREAEGGTIFLDEIGELPAEAQVKLLRVLQQQEVEPVGATRPVKVDVRILSATHRDLHSQIRQGAFREDLYFRLNVLPITIPSLRERPEDILLLAEAFIKRFAVLDGIFPKPLTQAAQQYLTSCSWTGNVRELENLIRRSLVLSEESHITDALLHQLHDKEYSNRETFSLSQPIIPTQAASHPLATAGCFIALQQQDGTFKTMAEIEQEVMQAVQKYHNGNITQAAAALAIAKSTFYRKIQEGKKNG